jgi:hypothetical protein
MQTAVNVQAAVNTLPTVSTDDPPLIAVITLLNSYCWTRVTGGKLDDAGAGVVGAMDVAIAFAMAAVVGARSVAVGCEPRFETIA